MAYMLESHFVNRSERILFNSLPSYAAVVDWAEERGWVGEGVVEGTTGASFFSFLLLSPFLFGEKQELTKALSLGAGLEKPFATVSI